MADPSLLPPKNRGLTAIGGAMSLIAVLLMVQIWVLTSTLQAWLAGAHRAALPGAVFSGVLFALCVGLYLFVVRVDAEVRRE